MKSTGARPTCPASDLVNVTSIHEAGHAVAALTLRRGVKIVSIRGEGHIGGFVETVVKRSGVRLFRERSDGSFVARPAAELREPIVRRTRDFIVVLLAGREAERQILPDVTATDGDKIDLETIDQLLPDALKSGEEPARLMEQLHRRTETLIRRHFTVVIRLAQYLVANETLTGQQARAVFDGSEFGWKWP